MKAICRVAKCKGSVTISRRTEHNYRKGETLNADPNRAALNKEYVNDFDTLSQAIDNRLKDVGIIKTRKDAVKAMEFILSATPEYFPRNTEGFVTEDYRESVWLHNNLQFMQEKYGKNLIAFTLHQDELTPHIHALVVPITDDNRLCAKKLFNPQTLRQLQTEYASSMGLERGLAGSKARHQDIRQIYANQQRLRQGITIKIEIDKPGFFESSPTQWQAEQQQKINAQLEPWLIAAMQYAKENEELKKSQQQNEKMIQQLQKDLAVSNKLVDRYLLLANENRFNKTWLEGEAAKIQNKYAKPIEAVIARSLKGITNRQEFVDRMAKEGYKLISRFNKIPYFAKPDIPVAIYQTEALFDRIDKVTLQTKQLAESMEAKRITDQNKKEQTQGRKVGNG